MNKSAILYVLYGGNLHDRHDNRCYGTISARSEYTHLTLCRLRHGACARSCGVEDGFGRRPGLVQIFDMLGGTRSSTRAATPAAKWVLPIPLQIPPLVLQVGRAPQGQVGRVIKDSSPAPLTVAPHTRPERCYLYLRPSSATSTIPLPQTRAPAMSSSASLSRSSS